LSNRSGSATNGSYDILLLDLNYARDTTSGGEGLELLSRIRQIDKLVPVVLMTAWGSVELAVEAMQGGGCDFIQKPWDNHKLLELLRRHIAAGRTLREQKQKEQVSERVMREIVEAREIQQRLLPEEMPRVSGCEIHATWKPANDVGGDYFDAIRLGPSSVAFCIADVAGKGLPAALLMSNLQAAVRAMAPLTDSPAILARRLNEVVWKNTAAGRFVTLFYGILDTASRTLHYSNSGHLPPVLIHKDGTTSRLTEGGIVLGLFPDAAYAESKVSLASGDRLVLITDGITEASRPGGEDFSEDRLIELLVQQRHMPSAQLQDAVMKSVESFTGQGFQDDATLMTLSMV
jgi:sigma-B regulation protein RsbU (phosphoserine phosphatase)